MSVSVIIPTLNAASYLPGLLKGLRQQTIQPLEVLVIDSSSTDDTASIAVREGCVVMRIPRTSFNHGGTRNVAASRARGDILVFMTQDALPFDQHFLEEITHDVARGVVAASYARQIPFPKATPLEVFARLHNYPPHSHVRTPKSLSRTDIKRYFFSNVASSVSANAFSAVGGFPDDVIMNEDMLLCAKLLSAGYSVSYKAEACVYHSHAFSPWQQFQRYFDIGVFMAENSVLLGSRKTGSDGIRFALLQIRFLLREKQLLWVVPGLLESIAKYVGYRLGVMHRWIPATLRETMSAQRQWWTRTN